MEIEPAKRNAGLVFQSYALWPHMTVAGNVDWPLKVGAMERRAAAGADRRGAILASASQRWPTDIPTRSPAGSSNAWPSRG